MFKSGLAGEPAARSGSVDPRCYTKFMRAVFLTFFILALSLVPALAWRAKPPAVQLDAVSARRGDGTIVLDGKVRNASDKPIEGLVLIFQFLAPEQTVLTAQKSNIDEDVLEPGQVSTFHFELDAPPRAVRYQVEATDHSLRDLRVGNSGPFTIE